MLLVVFTVVCAPFFPLYFAFWFLQPADPDLKELAIRL